MPITQNRMMALIDAALDYQNAIRRAEEFVREARDNVLIHHMDPIEQFDNLATLIDELGLLTDPKISPVIIQLERRHFKKTSAANIKRKEQQRTNRGGFKGKILTAPDSLIQMNSVQDEKSRVSQLRRALQENRLLITKVDGSLSPEERRAIDEEGERIQMEINKEEAYLRDNPHLRQGAEEFLDSLTDDLKLGENEEEREKDG